MCDYKVELIFDYRQKKKGFAEDNKNQQPLHSFFSKHTKNTTSPRNDLNLNPEVLRKGFPYSYFRKTQKIETLRAASG